jgi:predicted amidohydrolase YtcJ
MGKIYYNGRVYKGENSFAEAFSVRDGHFFAVGDNRSVLESKREGDELIDLSGAFVCAGFNDSHMHLLNLGQTLSFAPLAEHTKSLEDMLACLSRHLEAHPVKNGGWLLGRGWNQDYFKDVRRMPNRFDLDTVSSDVPIMITRACGHCCALNSKALEIAGITENTPCPEGGRIGMDAGKPDGRLFDNAMELLRGAMREPTIEELKDMIRLACRKLNSYGITSAQTDDYCVFRDIPAVEVDRAYRELEAAGELTVRVYEQCNFTELGALRDFIEEGNITGKGTPLFRTGPLKLLGDGALGSRTAYLSEPYRDDPKNRGFTLFTKEEMNALVSLANENGMQVAVHAIGDACLDMVLDAYEEALMKHPRADHRHGIVHCQISRADQLERIARLKLHVYVQSIFLDYDNHIVERLVSPALAATSYSWKTLIDRGVSVSNGSDSPVEPPDAMRGVECAVTRTSLDGTGPFLSDEAFSVSEALDSFTVRGAEASFEEKAKGLIKSGHAADFVMLGADPFATEPNKLHAIPVLKTYLSGECVYSK